MNGEQLLKTIGGIDARFLDEAENQAFFGKRRARERRIRMLKNIAAAAAVMLAVTIPVMVTVNRQTGNEQAQTIPETLPESTGVEEQREIAVPEAGEFAGYLVMNDDDGITFWDRQTGEQTGSLSGVVLCGPDSSFRAGACVIGPDEGVVVYEAAEEKKSFGYYLPGEERYVLEPAQAEELHVLKGFFVRQKDSAGNEELYSPEGEKIDESAESISISYPDGKYIYSPGWDYVYRTESREKVSTAVIPMRLYDNGVCVEMEIKGSYGRVQNNNTLCDVFSGEVLMERSRETIYFSGVENGLLIWEDGIWDMEGTQVFDPETLREKSREVADYYPEGEKFRCGIDYLGEDEDLCWEIYLDSEETLHKSAVAFCDKFFQVKEFCPLNVLCFDLSGPKNARSRDFWRVSFQVKEENVTEIVLQNLRGTAMNTFSVQESYEQLEYPVRIWQKRGPLLNMSGYPARDSGSFSGHDDFLMAGGQLIWDGTAKENANCIIEDIQQVNENVFAVEIDEVLDRYESSALKEILFIDGKGSPVEFPGE